MVSIKWDMTEKGMIGKDTINVDITVTDMTVVDITGKVIIGPDLTEMVTIKRDTI